MIDFNLDGIQGAMTSADDPIMIALEKRYGTPQTVDTQSPFDLSLLMTGAEICAGDYPITWVWDKMWPEKSIILLYGKGGCGKSTITTQAVDAVSDGLPYLGLNTEKRPVVILDYENPMGVLKSRGDNVNPHSNVFYWTISANPPQLNQPDWESLKSLVVTLGNPLLIFDTLQSACSDLDINSNFEYSPIMSKLKHLSELGATIILLHHTPKSDDTQYLGASIIYSQSDHVMAMFPVNKAGLDKECTDSDSAKVYRFGSKDKTRYAHHKIYVKFDEDKKLFVKADGPDQEVIKILQETIEEIHPANQSAILKHENIKTLVGRNTAAKLLKDFNGVYWNSYQSEKNSILYVPIFISGKQEPQNIAENTVNTEFPSLPEWARETGKQDYA